MDTKVSKPRVKGYSIWLIPKGQVQSNLNSIIQQISSHFSSSIFDPHLTLLGQIEDDHENILSAFQKLGRSCSPLTLQIESIAYEDVYFRSLYFKIGQSPQLLALNREARAIFKRKSEALFSPHISLLYSFALESEKQAVLDQLRIPHSLNIPIASMELMRTEGEVQDWELIERIEIQ